MRTPNDVQEGAAGKESKFLEGAYRGDQESLQILTPDSDLSFILIDATIARLFANREASVGLLPV
jgi:hypothetical protein